MKTVVRSQNSESRSPRRNAPRSTLHASRFRKIALIIAAVLLFCVASVVIGTVIYILTGLYLWLNS